MEESPSFGTWLKRRRKALDLTQADLAQRVSCSVVSIRKFESDTQRPSRQLAELLAAQLQIPPEERASFVGSHVSDWMPPRPGCHYQPRCSSPR